MSEKKKSRFSIDTLEERIAPAHCADPHTAANRACEATGADGGFAASRINEAASDNWLGKAANGNANFK